MITPQFPASSGITYDSSMDGTVQFRSNGGAVMFDMLPLASLPANDEITVVNADPRAILQYAAAPGRALDGNPVGWGLLGPGQMARIVSDGTEYWTIQRPDRVKFKTDNTLYCSPTGNDANSGIDPSVPFKTIQAGMDATFRNFDIGGWHYNFQLSDGTYAGFSIRGSMTGHYANPSMEPIASFNVVGNVADPSKVIIDGALGPNGLAVESVVGKSLHIDGMTIQSSVAGGILANLPGTELVIHHVHFGDCDGAMIQAAGNAAIIGGQIDVFGDAPFFLYCDQGGCFEGGGFTTFHGARTFNGFVVGAARTANISIGGMAMSVAAGGSVSGQRWKTLLNGTIDGGGTDLNTLIPGSSSGANVQGGAANPNYP